MMSETEKHLLDFVGTKWVCLGCAGHMMAHEFLGALFYYPLNDQQYEVLRMEILQFAAQLVANLSKHFQFCFGF